MINKKSRPGKYAKKTILMVGEGPTEKAFLQYIKELFISREADHSVKVHSGSGGSPRSVIHKTIRLRNNSAYDKCFVLLDADITLETDSKQKTQMKRKPRVEILRATPCIEGLFLAILRYPNFSQNNLRSDACKREFESKYLPRNKKTYKDSYTGVFPREMLEDRRKYIEELDIIMNAMRL
ncbi:RloB domain-containing protein [Candidatus Auribacterota bacterium]